MKMTIIQTVIVLEDDEQPQPALRIKPYSFRELLERLKWEAAHGRSAGQRKEEEIDGPYVPQ